MWLQLSAICLLAIGVQSHAVSYTSRSDGNAYYGYGHQDHHGHHRHQDHHDHNGHNDRHGHRGHHGHDGHHDHHDRHGHHGHHGHHEHGHDHGYYGHLGFISNGYLGHDLGLFHSSDINNQGYNHGYNLGYHREPQHGYSSVLVNHHNTVHHAPVNHAPVHQARVHEAPVLHTSVHHAPVHHAPVHHAPVHHAPVHHAPVHHAPVHHAPAQLGYPYAPLHPHYDHGHDDHYQFPAYSFAYSVNDPHTGDNKAQQETRHGDHVTGEYHLVQPDGNVRYVHYSADDHTGFKADVHYKTTHGHYDQHRHHGYHH